MSVGDAFEPDVASAVTVVDGFADRELDRGSGGFLPKGMAQEHGGAEDLRNGVGDAFSSNIGCGAAAGFIETKGQGSVGIGRAEAGAGEHTEGTSDHGHFVAQDVAEKVFGEDDVEAFRLFDELHGSVVHVEVAKGDVGVFGGDFGDGFTPEDAVFEDVGFVDGGEFFTALLRGLKGDVGDANDLAAFVNHGVDGNGFAISYFGEFRLAKVEATGEFAHAKHVESAVNEVGTNGRGVGEGGEAKGGAQIGEEAEMFAERKECGAFGLEVGRERFPFGAADAAEENGVAFFAGVESTLGEGVAFVVDGDAADVMFGKLEVEGEVGGDFG